MECRPYPTMPLFGYILAWVLILLNSYTLYQTPYRIYSKPNLNTFYGNTASLLTCLQLLKWTSNKTHKLPCEEVVTGLVCLAPAVTSFFLHPSPGNCLTSWANYACKVVWQLYPAICRGGAIILVIYIITMRQYIPSTPEYIKMYQIYPMCNDTCKVVWQLYPAICHSGQ